MSLLDKQFEYLPEYTNDMYKNYNEVEVWYAFHKKMRDMYLEQRQAEAQEPDFSNVKFTSEVRIKR